MLVLCIKSVEGMLKAGKTYRVDRVHDCCNCGGVKKLFEIDGVYPVPADQVAYCIHCGFTTDMLRWFPFDSRLFIELGAPGLLATPRSVMLPVKDRAGGWGARTELRYPPSFSAEEAIW